MKDLKAYPVWDANVRWFHWINLLSLLGLIAVGVAILNDKALGVTSDGKIVGTVPVTTHRSFHINALMLHPHFQTIDNLAKKWAEAQLDKIAGSIGKPVKPDPRDVQGFAAFFARHERGLSIEREAVKALR